MEWWNKPSWDARLRGALFNKDYDLAQTIALDRIHRRDPEDTETILAANACYSLQHGRPAVTYLATVESAVREAFPFHEQFHLRAISDVASALGPTPQGVRIAEQVFEAWERCGTPKDTEDAWPKEEEPANRARAHLASLYKQTGRPADAAMVLPEKLCRHMEPVHQYLSLRSVGGAYRLNENAQIVYSVGVVLDVKALASRLNLPREVETIDCYDRKAAYADLGFRCSVHLMWLLGIHHADLMAEDPRRDPATWFR
jgi:hypothetical protein